MTCNRQLQWINLKRKETKEFYFLLVEDVDETIFIWTKQSFQELDQMEGAES